jgi:hypothetical protein
MKTNLVPAYIKPLGIRILFMYRHFLYQIATKNGFVYMSISPTPYENDERFVVIVNAKDFYEDFIGRRIHIPSFHFIPSNYEYKKLLDAQNGFSHGESNPVPLAEVSCWNGCISFTNGITRTKWLVMNEAACFPVECSKNSARSLYDKYSYKQTEIRSVAELFSEGCL